MESDLVLKDLLAEVRQCRLCEDNLPLGPRPVLSASVSAKILIVGQAPGTKVHASGIPWNDSSGDRLRKWMGIESEVFYDENKIAIIPMGFCYPGKGKSGDLPPRHECAVTWHRPLLAELRNIELTLLVGAFAQRHYLAINSGETLTTTVKNWQKYLPEKFPLVHPSPRNQRWLKSNAWFEDEVVDDLQRRVRFILNHAATE